QSQEKCGDGKRHPGQQALQLGASVNESGIGHPDVGQPSHLARCAGIAYRCHHLPPRFSLVLSVCTWTPVPTVYPVYITSTPDTLPFHALAYLATHLN